MRWLLLYPRHTLLRRLFSSSPPVETRLDVLLLSSHLCPPVNPLYGAAVKEFALSRIYNFEGKPWQLRAVRLGSQWRFVMFASTASIALVTTTPFHVTGTNLTPMTFFALTSSIACFRLLPFIINTGGSSWDQPIIGIAYCSLHIAHSYCVLRIACFSISSVRGSHAPPLRDS